MEHWKLHRPDQYTALKDPQGFFTRLGEDAAARYQEIRDGMLEGLSPNDGSIDWPGFLDRMHQADDTAREMVETEMIYLPPD